MVGPTDIASGLLQGFCGAAQEIVGALAGVVEEPVRGAIENGALGAAEGLATGVLNLVRRPLRGGIILIEKVTVGVCNQVERGLSGEASLRRPKRYLFHRSWFDLQWGDACWSPTKDADASAHHDPCEGLSEERKREILNAYQLAKSAQRVLARLQNRPAGNGGLLDDIRVWWSSFLSLLKSTAFYRVLTETRPNQDQHDGSVPDCFAGCSGRLSCSKPPGKVSQESSWLADWTSEQIRRYQRWYQGRFHEDDIASTTTIESSSAAQAAGAAGRPAAAAQDHGRTGGQSR